MRMWRALMVLCRCADLSLSLSLSLSPSLATDCIRLRLDLRCRPLARKASAGLYPSGLNYPRRDSSLPYLAMAPKIKQALAKPGGKPEKKKKAENQQEDGRLKRLNLEFLTHVSAVSQLPANDVRKVLEGLRKVLLLQLRDKKSSRVPNIVVLRMKTLKARAATKKVLFGVEKEIKERPETKRVVCNVLKSFRADSGR